MACYRDEIWVSEQNFLIGDSKVFTSGKPDPSPEEQNEPETERYRSFFLIRLTDVIACSNFDFYSDKTMTPVTSKTRGRGPVEEDDEDEVNFTTPVRGGDTSEIPREMLKQMALETPGDHLDLEKLRPKPVNLELSTNSTVTPSR